MDPFTQTPTMVMICDIATPSRAPPTPAIPATSQEGEAYLKSTGIGDTAFWARGGVLHLRRHPPTIPPATGPSMKSTQSRHWKHRPRRGRTWATKPRPRKAISRCAADKFQDLRSEMVLTLEKLGIEIEGPAPRVATAARRRST